MRAARKSSPASQAKVTARAANLRRKAADAFLSDDEARQYGFDWPPLLSSDTVAVPGPHVQVTRVASVERRNGVYRIVEVRTEHERLNIYVSPKGRVRVYRGGRELT